jgi:hypothetical protein
LRCVCVLIMASVETKPNNKYEVLARVLVTMILNKDFNFLRKFVS